jgi:hypothetical protein
MGQQADGDLRIQPGVFPYRSSPNQSAASILDPD